MRERAHSISVSRFRRGLKFVAGRSNGTGSYSSPAHRVEPSNEAVRAGSTADRTGRGTAAGWRVGLVLAAAFTWSYWPTLSRLWEVWSHNQDYSGGRIVPLIAAYLVWTDRKALGGLPVRTCWWGLAALVGSQALRLLGLIFGYASLEQYSLVLAVGGLGLMMLGTAVIWRLKWILLFLMLLVPLPRRLHEAISLPLQEVATSSAVFGLEMLGTLVSREGNVLRLGDSTTVAVAEACSGLRMLTAFIVVAAVLAFLVRRPAWQKVLLLFLSLPVGIVANSLRLIVTALIYESVGSEVAESFFHDFAGLVMMPLAIVALLGLLGLMGWLSSDGSWKWTAPGQRERPAALRTPAASSNLEAL